MELFPSIFGLALITNDGNGYLPVAICYLTMIGNFFYTHIQCNSYKDNVYISESHFVVILTCERSCSEMNSSFLTVIVLLLQSVVFGQFNNDLSQDTNGNNEIGLRIFGFEESTDNCARIPRTRKEKLIGITYNLLCKHFGPHARDRILRSVNVVKKNIPHRMMKKIFTNCLNRMKPNMISCFTTVFDDYDLAGNEKPPQCLANLAVYPEKKFQIFWLKKFPLILEYLDRVIKGYKMFNPSRVVVEKYLDQGIVKRWRRVPHFDYAKTKIGQWKASDITSEKLRLKEIIGEPSNLLDICVFSNKWLRNPHDFEDNICLRKILGNLLVLETFLQKQGVTLETEFMFGRYLLLHLLHIVKSVIRSRDSLVSRRAMNVPENLQSKTVAQLNDLKAQNIKCLDDLRRTYDQKNGTKLSNVMKTHELQECLNSVLKKTEAAGDAVKKNFLKTMHAKADENLKFAEKTLIRSLIRSHKKMKPLKPILQDMVELGIPEPSDIYPWANQLINKFKTSNIANDHARLGNAHTSTSYSSSTSCKRSKSSGPNGKNKCWSNYVTQNMIVENELKKSGLSMQEIYLGDPGRMNMIYYIDEGLRRSNQNRNRVVAQYRRSLANSPNADELIEKLLEEELGALPESTDDDTESRRSFGVLETGKTSQDLDPISFISQDPPLN